MWPWTCSVCIQYVVSTIQTQSKAFPFVHTVERQYFKLMQVKEVGVYIILTFFVELKMPPLVLSKSEGFVYLLNECLCKSAQKSNCCTAQYDRLFAFNPASVFCFKLSL